MEPTNPRQSVALIIGVIRMAGVALTEALKKPAALGVNESEEVNISLNSTMLSNVLEALTSSPSSKLSHVTLQTGTKQYMGPIFDPILSTQLVPRDSTFVEDYPKLPFPNFYYALEDILASYSKTITHSVHRYIGNKYSWEHFWDMSDARVPAEQQIWASVTDKAKNEAFTCTNGDVFTWKMIWRVFCDVFGVEFVPFDEKERFDFVEFMKDKGEVWDTIVEENGLYATKMEEITCLDACQLLKLEIQHVCSMNKSREFGFMDMKIRSRVYRNGLIGRDK
ncbi:hypothetical protein E3N88_02727 [Mikania micrantha]|uniref:Uncharacterized protein n=1 Tax=Mikania micrantha TaxID=192012 RepID=A0A5N6Q6M6_9ASTR|nr:hypothetical protein E3N88_02727 [Mikania micrantha]